MSEESMVEKVARAIDPMAWAIPEDDYPAEKARREARQFQSLSAARAAIEAMRAPTVDMIAASDYGDLPGFHPRLTIDGWQAMIDAALKEGE